MAADCLGEQRLEAGRQTAAKEAKTAAEAASSRSQPGLRGK